MILNSKSEQKFWAKKKSIKNKIYSKFSDSCNDNNRKDFKISHLHRFRLTNITFYPSCLKESIKNKIYLKFSDGCNDNNRKDYTILCLHGFRLRLTMNRQVLFVEIIQGWRANLGLSGLCPVNLFKFEPLAEKGLHLFSLKKWKRFLV